MIRRFLQNLYDDFSAEQTRYIALVPILFGLGIGIYFGIDFEPKYWLSLIFIELLLLIFYFVRRRVAFHLPLFGLLLITLGFADAQLHTLYQSRRVETIGNVNTYISGQIADISQSVKGKPRYLLRNVSDFDKPLKGNFRLTAMTKNNKFAIGDCVETAATLLETSAIPLQNSFPLNRKYFYDGLSSTGYTLGDVFKTVCPENSENFGLQLEINGLRNRVIKHINRVLPRDEAGVVDAVLLGEKSYIPAQITEDYRNSGLAHFLAVSGLHLGTIAGLVFFLVRWFVSLFPFLALRYDSKKIAAAAAIVFAFLYMLISGMAIPAERAFIMTTTVLIGVMFNRQAISLRMVSFAALTVLIFSPSALVSVSFQMSFAAVTALVVFYEKYAQTISAWSRDRGFIVTAFYYLVGVVICDFIASLATSPFAIYHFQRLALYTSLGNLLAGPLIAFWLMPAILGCLFVLPFNIMIYPLKILGFGVAILNKITAYVAALPHSVLYVHSLGFAGFMLIVSGAIWLCVWQRKWRYYGTIAIVCGCLTMFFKPLPDAVIAFDGNGVLLRASDGEMILAPLGKANNWTKEIWRENFGMKEPDKAEKKTIKQIFAGKKVTDNLLEIECDRHHNCVYKNMLKFNADGSIFLRDKEIDKTMGAYIYFSGENAYFEPLTEASCRPWQNCEQNTIKAQ